MAFIVKSNQKENKYVQGSNYGPHKRKTKPFRTRKQLLAGVYIPDLPIPVHLNPKLDKQTKVNHLRTKLLNGFHVTHSEIDMVAHGNRAHRKKNQEIEKEIHMTDSDILHLSPPLSQELLYVDKGIVGIPTPNNPGPLANSFGTPNELRVSMNGVDTQETHQRYRYFVDMSGFQDAEINFALQGRRLLITGERAKSKHHNAKSASEIIRLPPDLEPDNLRAVRDCFGTVILEEAWKF